MIFEKQAFNLININTLIRSLFKSNTNFLCVKENTKSHIFNGIGNQLHIDTLDQFCQCSLKQYAKQHAVLFPKECCYHDHSTQFIVIENIDDNDSNIWFDNIIRVREIVPGINEWVYWMVVRAKKHLYFIFEFMP